MTLIQRHGRYTLIFRHEGKQKWWATGECDRRAAEKRAKAYLESINRSGFELTVAALAKRRKRMTIEDVCEWYEDAPIDVRKTTKSRNIWCLKYLAKQLGLQPTDSASLIMPGHVKRWLLEHPNRDTANSILKQAKSVVAHGCPVVPEGLTVSPLKASERLYRWPTDEEVSNLLKAAQRWQSEAPKVYLAWLLCSQLGLRASEATHARRSWVSGEVFHVREESDFRIKNRKDRAIPLPEDVKRAIETIGGPEYILPGSTQSAREQIIADLNKAIKDTGWTRRMKAHEMRKLFGAQVATQAGIFAASRLLGNSPMVADKTYTALTAMPKYTLLG